MRQSQWMCILILAPMIAAAQILINDFDAAATDGSINWLQVETDASVQEVSNDSSDAHEGAAALREYCFLGSINEWGTFAHTGYNTTEAMDWSESDSLFVWIKVHIPPEIPESFLMRMHLIDQPEGEATEEHLYENTTILDTQSEWMKLGIPLVQRESDGETLPNDEGFVIFPSSWGRGSENNLTLDKDWIVGYSFALVTTSIEEDEIEFSLDYFTRSGAPNAVAGEAETVRRFELSANYPNPFNPSTQIAFTLPEAEHVRLTVFNLMGQTVRTLADGRMSAGPHHVRFHAGDLPAGVYFYRLETQEDTRTRKMILLP